MKYIISWIFQTANTNTLDKTKQKIKKAPKTFGMVRPNSGHYERDVFTPFKMKIINQKLHARVTITRVNNTPKIMEEEKVPGYVS